MSASKARRRTLAKQLQFAGPWTRGRLPAPTVPGLNHPLSSPADLPTRLHRPMPRSLDAAWILSRGICHGEFVTDA